MLPRKPASQFEIATRIRSCKPEDFRVSEQACVCHLGVDPLGPLSLFRAGRSFQRAPKRVHDLDERQRAALSGEDVPAVGMPLRILPAQSEERSGEKLRRRPAAWSPRLHTAHERDRLHVHYLHCLYRYHTGGTMNWGPLGWRRICSSSGPC
jgi:hypothetical protein